MNSMRRREIQESRNIANCHPRTDYVQFAESLEIDLTVVGPEAPLVAGVVDQFRSRGMAIVGPDGGKCRAGRQQSPLQAFHGAHRSSDRALRNRGQRCAKRGMRCGNFGFPWFSRLMVWPRAKGVIIAQTAEEAEAALSIAGLPDGD